MSALVGFYVLVAAFWAFGFGGIASGEAGKSRATFARVAIAAPVWPVIVLAAIGRGLWWLVREATR